jgi:5-methyltetrahydropteroyltriglutamate--homocysteine methyltransferase
MKTTVVGSYPVPDWLKAHPSASALEDAIVVAMHAQEAAGIDLISDGEIGRWDIVRREPGGMVERFVRAMSGVRGELTA